MGRHRPHSVAYLRWIKAQGGWGVVNTELCSIHPSTECEPLAYASLWDDHDVAALQLQTALLHEQQALAGVELMYGGAQHTNLLTRRAPLSAAFSQYTTLDDPLQTHVMDKADIGNLRRWHAAAARRAVDAGFDIVYVYAGHGMLPLQFLQTRFNERTDEYGGSLRNRTRLLRELIDATREAVGDRAAVALRIAVDELNPESNIRHDGEMADVLTALAPLVDLWDVCLMSWQNDSQTSRFQPSDAYQRPYVQFVKQVVGDVPVVGVGRFTSPDLMVEQLRSGTLDLIGAARPSIADPYIPNKIAEGREDDVRECIACNICASADNRGVPIRCTQNPTMGEEWRRGWHPEHVPRAASKDRHLVVGAGPAGLECALTLARRGYSVTLADARAELGGRVQREASLPPLRVWNRVATWRQSQLAPLTNVHVYRGSPLAAADVLEFDAERVVLATGARWRRNLRGRSNYARAVHCAGTVDTPDDVMRDVDRYVERARNQHVAVYDDDLYYMASVLAEVLAAAGVRVTFVTSAAKVGPWLENTLEQERTQTRLLELGVTLLCSRVVVDYDDASKRVTHQCAFTGAAAVLDNVDRLIGVTSREPNTQLYDELQQHSSSEFRAVGNGRLQSAVSPIKSICVIGDAYAPSTIQAAVYAGHERARIADDEQQRDSWTRKERILVRDPQQQLAKALAKVDLNP